MWWWCRDAGGLYQGCWGSAQGALGSCDGVGVLEGCTKGPPMGCWSVMVVPGLLEIGGGTMGAGGWGWDQECRSSTQGMLRCDGGSGDSKGSGTTRAATGSSKGMLTCGGAVKVYSELCGH